MRCRTWAMTRPVSRTEPSEGEGRATRVEMTAILAAWRKRSLALRDPREATPPSLPPVALLPPVPAVRSGPVRTLEELREGAAAACSRMLADCLSRS